MLNVISSGLESSSSIISSEPSWLAGVEIITNGTDPATVTVYDNTEDSGVILFKGTVAGASNFDSINFQNPVRADDGLYLDLSGTGATSIVYFIN